MWEVQDFPLSSNTFQLLLWDPKAFQIQMGYIIPPVSSSLLDTTPPQLAPFDGKHQRLCSKRFSLPVSLSTATLQRKTHFSCLYPQSHSLNITHSPWLWVGKSRALLSNSIPCLVQSPHYCWRHTYPSVNLLSYHRTVTLEQIASCHF